MSKPQKPVLLIMAHGSRKVQANEEFIQLVQKIAATHLDYAAVKHCFLEIAAPTLQDAVEECLLLGQQHFDLYPLFFNQGNHVSRDIPEQIANILQHYPECHIRQLSYFGEYDGLQGMLSQHILQQKVV